MNKKNPGAYRENNKEEISMKKLIKCLAVLATVAVLVLNVTSCGNPAGNDNSSETIEPDNSLYKNIDGTIVAIYKDNWESRTLTFFTNEKGSFYQYDSFTYKAEKLISSRTEEIGTYTCYRGTPAESFAHIYLEPTEFRLKNSDTWREFSDGAFYSQTISIINREIPQPRSFEKAFKAMNGITTTSFKRIK